MILLYLLCALGFKNISWKFECKPVCGNFLIHVATWTSHHIKVQCGGIKQWEDNSYSNNSLQLLVLSVTCSD